jgi:hypothetical protein
MQIELPLEHYTKLVFFIIIFYNVFLPIPYLTTRTTSGITVILKVSCNLFRNIINTIVACRPVARQRRRNRQRLLLGDCSKTATEK